MEVEMEGIGGTGRLGNRFLVFCCGGGKINLSSSILRKKTVN